MVSIWGGNNYNFISIDIEYLYLQYYKGVERDINSVIDKINIMENGKR